jgi:hypothetical protein
MKYEYRLEEVPADKIAEMIRKKEEQRKKEEEAWAEEDQKKPATPPADKQLNV